MEKIEGLDREIKAIKEKEGKYLTFTLANEEYGINATKIREIIRMMQITSVPKIPNYVKGVINLRGKVIPVVDLRLRFGMAGIDYTDRTCIIVVELKGQDDMVLMEFGVDSVSEVLDINQEDIEDTPNFGTNLNTEDVLGIAKVEGRVKILIDIDRVLGTEELARLETAI